jgi:hypothetical protein
MGILQNSFPTTAPVGFPGMRANSERENVISRTLESAAGVDLGQPVFRGASDMGAVVGAAFAATGVAAAAAGNTGNGAMGAITVSAGAKQGVYRLEITDVDANAGEFRVTDPDGNFVAAGDVAAAFSAGGLAFTLADGATDFVVGDSFTITVTYTANIALLGFVVYDPAVMAAIATDPDKIRQYATLSIMNQGILWVTAGATVVDGGDVYWNPATGRYTSTVTHIRMPNVVFDTSGADGDLVRIAIRSRLQ